MPSCTWQAEYQSSSYKSHWGIYAGLSCLWAGSHTGSSQAIISAEALGKDDADVEALQPDQAGLRGSSLEVSLAPNGAHKTGKSSDALGISLSAQTYAPLAMEKQRWHLLPP